MAEQLHYRRLLAEITSLVGKAEAERLAQGKTVEELAELKRRLLRDLMGKPRRAA